MKYEFQVTRSIRINAVGEVPGPDDEVTLLNIGDHVTILEKREKTEMEDSLNTYTNVPIVDFEVSAYEGQQERPVTVTVLTDAGNKQIRINNILSIKKVS